jgi:hypothetical protein
VLALPRHDVAIYSPNAWLFYDGESEHGGGGAERQTWLLAQSLARRGARVAHIVYPVAHPSSIPRLQSRWCSGPGSAIAARWSWRASRSWSGGR